MSIRELFSHAFAMQWFKIEHLSRELGEPTELKTLDEDTLNNRSRSQRIHQMHQINFTTVYTCHIRKRLTNLYSLMYIVY
jgi:hypothetical protein